jgi:hypothetical protein
VTAPEELTFTCTGHGGHDRAALDRVAVSFPVVPGRTNKPGVSFDLRCPVCGLAKLIGYRVQQRLTDAGLAEVDISALPF